MTWKPVSDKLVKISEKDYEGIIDYLKNSDGEIESKVFKKNELLESDNDFFSSLWFWPEKDESEDEEEEELEVEEELDDTVSVKVPKEITIRAEKRSLNKNLLWKK